MRNGLPSPLSGIRSPFGLRDGVSAYAVAGLEPELVFDFENEVYRTNGSTSTFDDAMTFSRSGNATMVDSDGLLKWAPHNLLRSSEQFENWVAIFIGSVSQNVIASPDGTVSADALYATTGGSTNSYVNLTGLDTSNKSTCSVWVKKGSNYSWFRITFNTAGTSAAWFDLDNGVVGTTVEFTDGSASITPYPNGWYKCSWSDTVSSSTAIVFGLTDSDGSTFASNPDGDAFVYVWGAHLYRSDLGGMVDNPDTGNSYVPTTSSAVYLPRRGHHVYNGTSWVNEGVLVESEARTNLVTHSNDFTDASWSDSNITFAQDVTGPDGVSNSAWTATISDTGNRLRTTGNTVVAETTYTFSFYAKKGTATGVKYAVYDLSNAAFIVAGTSYESDINSTDWSRVYVTFTTPVGCTNVYVYLASGSSSTGTIFFYGAQLEEGSTPSSYIPTSGSTVTRAADSITVPSAKLPWNPLAVSIQMQGRMTYADSGNANEVVQYFWQLNSDNQILARINTSGAENGRMTFLQESLNVLDAVAGDFFDPGINIPFNISSRHGSTFINGAVDGTALTADTTPTALPDLSSTDLDLAYDYMGTIKLFRMWSDDLADAGIEEAST